jgi:hypothetical protein
LRTAPSRRTLAAVVTATVSAVTATAAAALLPVAPALAQTATPTPVVTQTPAPAAPQLSVDRAVVDVGGTLRLTVTGAAGAAVELSGNGLPIRTATVPADGQVSWDLRPGDRTLFSAVVGGARTETVTVRVRRTVTIGIRQDVRGVYTFSGQVARPEAGLQVTVARLDGETGRVTGVASTATTADGRYELRTSLPQGLAGYYALTGVTATPLEPGRSRLYGLLVNTRPGPAPSSQPITLTVRQLGEYSVFGGTVPGGADTPITLARVVDGRLVGVLGARTNRTGGFSLSVPLAPGSYVFRVLTATAQSPAVAFVAR